MYLRALRSDADDVQMSYGDLGEWLGMSESTAKRTVRELVGFGALEKENVTTTHGIQANDYWVIYARPDPAGSVTVDPTQIGSNLTQPSSCIKEEDTVANAPTTVHSQSDIFEAVCGTFGIDMGSLTKSGAGNVGRTAKELRAVGATPESITAVYALMLAESGGPQFVTHNSMAVRWAEYIGRITVAAPPKPPTLDPTLCALAFADSDDGLTWIYPGTNVECDEYPGYFFEADGVEKPAGAKLRESLTREGVETDLGESMHE
jgi:hypothetical protein